MNLQKGPQNEKIILRSIFADCVVLINYARLHLSMPEKFLLITVCFKEIEFKMINSST